jgi:hypothetical protein
MTESRAHRRAPAKQDAAEPCAQIGPLPEDKAEMIAFIVVALLIIVLAGWVAPYWFVNRAAKSLLRDLDEETRRQKERSNIDYSKIAERYHLSLREIASRDWPDGRPDGELAKKPPKPHK